MYQMTQHNAVTPNTTYDCIILWGIPLLVTDRTTAVRGGGSVGLGEEWGWSVQGREAASLSKAGFIKYTKGFIFFKDFSTRFSDQI